jgi:hypothetical protein
LYDNVSLYYGWCNNTENYSHIYENYTHDYDCGYEDNIELPDYIPMDNWQQTFTVGAESLNEIYRLSNISFYALATDIGNCELAIILRDVDGSGNPNNILATSDISYPTGDVGLGVMDWVQCNFSTIIFLQKDTTYSLGFWWNVPVGEVIDIGFDYVSSCGYDYTGGSYYDWHVKPHWQPDYDKDFLFQVKGDWIYYNNISDCPWILSFDFPNGCDKTYEFESIGRYTDVTGGSNYDSFSLNNDTWTFFSCSTMDYTYAIIPFLFTCLLAIPIYRHRKRKVKKNVY